MKKDLILSVNAGSSSLKLALFHFNTDSESDSGNLSLTRLLNSSYSNLFTDKVKFKFKYESSIPSRDASGIPSPQEDDDVTTGKDFDHKSAFTHFLYHLKTNNESNINTENIGWITHRVVHGGGLDSPAFIDKINGNGMFEKIESISDLAPLHNASALEVIKACLTIPQLSQARSYALFDTTFHKSIPERIWRYAINPRTAEKRGLRKWGFHGLSYSYILSTFSSHLKTSPTSLNLIIFHLGSGASMCAIQHGKSLDTSMGLTPLDGLPGGTRSGGLDPVVGFHLGVSAKEEEEEDDFDGKVHLSEAERILNKESGFKALTGTSNFAEIVSLAKSQLNPPSPSHELAYALFLDRITNYLGAYILKLGGFSQISAFVFSGGIGENSPQLRSDILDICLRAAGVSTTAGTEDKGVREVRALDEEINSDPGKYKKGDEQHVVEISQRQTNTANPNICTGAKIEGGVRSFVCWTDEQYEMARILLESGEV